MTVDGTFESGVTGWTASNVTLAQDATQHHTGTKSGKLTAAAGVPARATIRPTTAYTATPNVMHTLSLWVYSAAGCSNFRASIDWQTGAGAAISTTETASTTIPAATWTQVTISGVAPSNAALYAFGPTLISPASGQIVFVDDIVPATVVIAAAQDSAYPPRVLVTVTGYLVGASLVVFRHHGDGTSERIRGGTADPTTDTALVVLDGEYPFGEDIWYAAQIDGTEVAWTDDLVYALPGGKVALSDPLTGLACEAVITAWPEITNDRGGTVFRTGAHTVSVQPPRAPGGEQDVEFLTETETARQQMVALLDGCTSGMILVRQPGGYFGIDGVYSVTTDTEARAAQSGRLERRLWTLHLVAVDAWPASLFATGWTLADIEDAYSGLTLADLAGDYGTLLDIATEDWGLV